MTRRLLLGNDAFCEGLIAGGVRFYAGYPITPCTEIAEAMSQRMPQVGGTYVQMEDELGSMAAIMGASATGVKSATASAGPGMALLQNELGQAIAAEVPLVVINVGRAGPGIGNATRSGQMELMQARYGANGEVPALVLSPSTVEEAFWLTVTAVNLAETLRTVVIVMGEGMLGLQRAVVDLPDYDTIELKRRPGPTVPPDEYLGNYVTTAIDGVPPIADFGSGYKSILSSVGISRRDGADVSVMGPIGEADQDFTIRRIHNKLLARKKEITFSEQLMTEDAEVVYIAFGTQALSAIGAMHEARASGIKAGVLRLITLWPFPEELVRACCAKARAVVVPEMNLGQLRLLVGNALANTGIKITGVNRVDSITISPQQILDATKEVLA